jgi:signal peptidase I
MIITSSCSRFSAGTIHHFFNPIQTRTNNSNFLSQLRVISFGRNPKATLIRIVVLVAVCWVVFGFILLPIRVTGISMLPTYRDHSLNLVNRLAYLRHEPQRGDVTSVRLTGLHVMFLKRIIGLPGETVAFANGQVLINGVALDEPYEKLPCDWNSPPVTLATDEYYFVGDNRSMPLEDHTHGSQKRDRIVGKVLF